MRHGIFTPPTPVNEPIKSYAPNSPERAQLKAKLEELRGQVIEIPLVIGGKEVRTGKTAKCVEPHDHGHVLANYHVGGPAEIEQAIVAANTAWKSWSELPFEARASVFLKAAELLAGPWRATLNAATMLGQSKTAFQAEIDAACELIDFWRWNAHYLAQISREQPVSGPQMWNRLEYRPLEGFVVAITPFNFTSIAGNLPTAPALCGNVALWKPASSAVYSAWFLMKLFEEAGLPPGVINFLPCSGADISKVALAHRDLAGVHFTGSTEVFNGIWRTVGSHLGEYKSYPRLVGETGGKDFVFAHPSADVVALCVALARGSFEYQGQKCSASSRAYVPRSLWPAVKERLLAIVRELKMGDPKDFTNFLGAVIDKGGFEKIKGAIDAARTAKDAEILIGGKCDASKGWFIEPTVILAKDPKYVTMREELFGPVLTIWVYEDAELDAALTRCDEDSPYSLTGAIFGRDRGEIERLSTRLRHSAGNFYVNDKPTGAVVGQQPFGGARASGTNDKAGSSMNLLRWLSPRTIKENFVPPTDWRYPHQAAP
ncbi:MAG: L-glutamate gamma-semialdehyde dehydrogenase [Planctomycetes bacterium]|nr:L-glutamate gamma-semialdehyde dehydrogenase [Planctomycetota bacterium]